MATSDGFLELPIDSFQWEKIKAESRGLMRGDNGLNSRTSMAGKRGNRHAGSGPAGEFAVARMLPFLRRVSGEEHYDFVAPNGNKIEVKTRSSMLIPAAHFDVRVPCYSFDRQQCGAYVFAFAIWKEDQTAIQRVVIVGWCTKERFGLISKVRAFREAEASESGFDQREGSTDLRFATLSVLEPLSSLKEWCS